LSGFGLVTALALFSLFAPALALPVDVPVAIPVSLLALWMIAGGAWMIVKARG
jgi:hypothetical protein